MLCIRKRISVLLLKGRDRFHNLELAFFNGIMFLRVLLVLLFKVLKIVVLGGLLLCKFCRKPREMYLKAVNRDFAGGFGVIAQ